MPLASGDPVVNGGWRSTWKLPVTQSFQSFPSDKPDAAVRQLSGRPGEVWGAESGTDRLVVIRTDGKEASR